ncbi:MAG: carboxypeptidase regulatory-like domain-containing protein [bacterium]|nr:carboxypeptidase regulatory-like domain-containing protein [bacterium]
MSAMKGEIRGIVEDINGKPLEGVTLKVTHGDQPEPERTAVTPASGEFVFVLLDPGSYNVEASLEGYIPVKLDNVRVQEGDPFILTIPMAPGSA